MSQTPTPGATGHVEPTPEAQPLDPTPAQPIGGSGGPTAAPPAGQRSDQAAGSGTAGGQAQADRAEEIGRELAERLKPVAAVAEGVVAKALDLSAKGLGRLAAKLHERRQRAAGGQDNQGG